MKLLQLSYFQAACRFGNLSRAATELHVSQPTISTAIKELETEFGVTLVHRLSKGILLTSEGEQLYKYAGILLENAQTVSQVMTDLGEKRNQLRVGVPPMIGTFLFPDIYQAFHRQYPQVSVTNLEKGRRLLLNDLSNDLIDVAIVPTNLIVSDEFYVFPLMQTETVLCVSQQHPLSCRTSAAIEDFMDCPLAMFNQGFYQNELVEKMYSDAGAKPKVVFTTSQVYSLHEFIVRNIACGFMLRPCAALSDKIVPLSIGITTDIGLVVKKQRHMFRDTLHFIHVAQSLIPGGAPV